MALVTSQPATLAFSANQAQLQNRIRTIAESPLGPNLSETECLAIASRARLKKYVRQQVLFNQGDPVRELILLTSGTVKMTQLSGDGKEVLLWACGRDHVLGIRAELTNHPYSCSAIALTPSTGLSWTHEDVTLLMQKHVNLLRNLSCVLMGRIHELEERFRELATEDVRIRLAFALLRLSREIGVEGAEGIEIRLSREEIARMTGTTLFTVSRIISGWARRHLVLAKRSSVIVPSLERMREIAHGRSLETIVR